MSLLLKLIEKYKQEINKEKSKLYTEYLIKKTKLIYKGENNEEKND